MKIYVVQKGDTLAEIAGKHGMTIEELQKMNGGLISDSDLVQGLKIKVSVGKKPLKKLEKTIRSENHNQPLITSQNLGPKISIQSPASNPKIPNETAPPNQPGNPPAAAASAGNPPESHDFSKVLYPKESHYPMLEENQAAAYGKVPEQPADYPFLTQGTVDVHHPYHPDPNAAAAAYNQPPAAGGTAPNLANSGSPLPFYYGNSGYGYPLPGANAANVKTMAPAPSAFAAPPSPPANPYPNPYPNSYPNPSAPAAAPAPSSHLPSNNNKWPGGSAAGKRNENVPNVAQPAPTAPNPSAGAGTGPAVNFYSAKPGQNVFKGAGPVQNVGKTAASPAGTTPIAPAAYPYPFKQQPAAAQVQPSPCGCNEPVYPPSYSAPAAYPPPAYYSNGPQGIPVYAGNQPPIPPSGQRWDYYPADTFQPFQPDFPTDDINEE